LERPELSPPVRSRFRLPAAALLDADDFEDLPGKRAGGDPEGGAEPAEAADRRRRLTLGSREDWRGVRGLRA